MIYHSLLFLFLSFLLFAGNGWGATYYVEQTGGNDSNAGTSTGAAWKTISKVNRSSFSAGDSILFKRGETWAETLTVPTSGSAGNVITYGAYESGVAPIINGGDARANCINLYKKNYITIVNIAVTGSTAAGILIEDGSTITIDNVTATSLGSGIRSYGVGNLTIRNSSFSDTTESDPYGDGIYIGPKADNIPSTNVLIYSNRFSGSFGRSSLVLVACETCSVYKNNFTPTYVWLESVIDIEPNPNQSVGDVLVYSNTFDYDISNRYAVEATNNNGTIGKIDVYNNIIDANGTGYGIKVRSGSSAFLIYGNTITGTKYGINAEEGNNISVTRNHVIGNATAYNIRILLKATVTASFNIIERGQVGVYVDATSTATLYNNTVSEYTETGIRAIGTVTAKNNIVTTTVNNRWFTIMDDSGKGTYDYNTYYAPNDTGYSGNVFFWNGTGYSTLAAFQTGSSQDAHSLSSDPKFVSASDLRLQSSSPARDAGTGVGLTSDFLGNPVPFGSAPDIGAYEYISSSKVPSTPSNTRVE